MLQRISTPDVLYDKIIEVNERVVLRDQVKLVHSDSCSGLRQDDSLTGEQVR